MNKLSVLLVCFLVVGCHSRTVEDSLSIQQVTGYRGMWIGWVVTNKNTQPITINKFVYNGEYQAQVGHWFGDTIRVGPNPLDKSNTKLPQRLTIGQQVSFVERTLQKNYYKKEIIFIDVSTNLGDFRYTIK